MIVTPDQIEEVGPDATALIVNIMQANAAWTADITRKIEEGKDREIADLQRTLVDFYESVERAIPHQLRPMGLESVLYRFGWAAADAADRLSRHFGGGDA